MSQPSIATTVRERRKKLFLNQVELAQLADVSEKFVRDVERGKATIQLDRLQRVLDVLGLTLDIVPRQADLYHDGAHHV